MAKEDDILGTLIADGAMINDVENGMLTLPIYAELMVYRGIRWLYFVQSGAEDQHHTHARAFDEAEIVHDRDLSLSRAGERVAYVAPINEWPEIDHAAMRESLALARNHLASDPERAEAFNDFVADCRPGAS